MKKIFVWFLFMVSVFANVILTGCTSNTTVSYDEKIIQKSKQRNVQLTPIYTDPALLPINYQVTKTGGSNYDVVIGDEVVQIEIPAEEPDIDSSVWKNNISEITEGKVFNTFQTAKAKVVSYITSSQIIHESDKESCINQIDQTPLYFIDGINSEQFNPDEIIPDAFFKDNAVWVLRTSQDSICEWMFTHELIHYLRELTNKVGTNPIYHGMILDEVLTDIICSSLNPSLNGNESGYAVYYDLGWKYISIWKEEAIKAYYYGYQDIWNITGKDEFDMFVFLSHNYDYNELAHDCTIFTLAKWESLYSVQ